jgi:hypothetical protein
VLLDPGDDAGCDKGVGIHSGFSAHIGFTGNIGFTSCGLLVTPSDQGLFRASIFFHPTGRGITGEYQKNNREITGE